MEPQVCYLKRDRAMTEAEIRSALIARLASSPAGVDAAFISELFLDNFSRRADLVMANGKLAVFEIKSSRDTLDRLSGQLETYLHFFEHVTVVCAPKHLAAVVAVVPEGVGVWEAGDDGTLRIVRRARARSLTSKENWVSFLPVDELRALLRMHELRAIGTRDELIREIGGLSLKAVREYVLSYMKRREQRIHSLREQRKETARVSPCRSVPKISQYLRQLQETTLIAIPRKVIAP
ncbi:sce7726 family protein [Achromobacter xylosoxidans]|nr:sce7726 family protein [Achromobacter xylosoxidans]